MVKRPAMEPCLTFGINKQTDVEESICFRVRENAMFVSCAHLLIV